MRQTAIVDSKKQLTRCLIHKVFRQLEVANQQDKNSKICNISFHAGEPNPMADREVG